VRVTQTVIDLPVGDERNEVFYRRCHQNDRDLNEIAERLGMTNQRIESTSVELLFKNVDGKWVFARTLTEPVCTGSDAAGKRPAGVGVPFQQRHRT
jgi:hypothetical protein